MKLRHIKVVVFDADDTLWVNEPYFREAEDKFCELLSDFLPPHNLNKELFKVEINNLGLYGYGIKAFMLSQIEAALEITNGNLDPAVVTRIIEYGKELLEKPIELLDGVEGVLQSLQGKYRLVVATKGDLLDQERKLKKSGLEDYFHHIEILSEKREENYSKLISHLDVKPEEFVMIGNSLKSDVLPVLNLGAYAIHVPFHTTWIHEQIDHQVEHEKFREVDEISDVVKFL
jgi:putative hydrolase of the HAD superfamily